MGNQKQKLTITDEHLEQIRKLAENIRYGSIALIFQDGVLIQIDKIEKIRLTK